MAHQRPFQALGLDRLYQVVCGLHLKGIRHMLHEGRHENQRSLEFAGAQCLGKGYSIGAGIRISRKNQVVIQGRPKALSRLKNSLP